MSQRVTPVMTRHMTRVIRVLGVGDFVPTHHITSQTLGDVMRDAFSGKPETAASQSLRDGAGTTEASVFVGLSRGIQGEIATEIKIRQLAKRPLPFLEANRAIVADRPNVLLFPATRDARAGCDHRVTTCLKSYLETGAQ